MWNFNLRIQDFNSENLYYCLHFSPRPPNQMDAGGPQSISYTSYLSITCLYVYMYNFSFSLYFVCILELCFPIVLGFFREKNRIIDNCIHTCLPGPQIWIPLKKSPLPGVLGSALGSLFPYLPSTFSKHPAQLCPIPMKYEQSAEMMNKTKCHFMET